MKKPSGIFKATVLFVIALVTLPVMSYYFFQARVRKSIPDNMVIIPGGWFKMGCQGALQSYCLENENPAVKVYINPFHLDITEVTVKDYWKCANSGQCENPTKERMHKLHDAAFNHNKSTKQDHPMNGVTWSEADNYCRVNGKRLPTEAEFEYALRGGLPDQTFPWGEAIPASPEFGNYLDLSAQETSEQLAIHNKDNQSVDDGYAYTAPICSYRKNSFGLCDISGNVTEWCEDYFNPNWYSEMPDKTNPVNPEPSKHRVTRGGDWHHEVGRSIRSSKRGHYPPDFSTFYIGFRCARTKYPSLNIPIKIFSPVLGIFPHLPIYWVYNFTFLTIFE